MKTPIFTLLSIFYTIIINSAELKIDAYGKSKTKV